MDLHPDPCNPRRIAEAELAALTRSIATFGCVDPVLARRADRRVIAGHQRLVAARRAGLTTVPVILLDLTAADARLLNEGRSLNPGDTLPELYPAQHAAIAQRRPEPEPRRHPLPQAHPLANSPRSTKAGA